MVSLSLCIVLTVTTFVLGILFGQLIRNKIPLIDYGHRCFGVPSEEVAGFLLKILAPFGLKENFTFSPAGTNQTLLNDGSTVLIWFEETVTREKLPPNGFSVVSKNPIRDADIAAEFLEQMGYSSKVHLLMPHKTNNIAIVESEAFLGWVLVFRLHSFKMGERPNLRRITCP